MPGVSSKGLIIAAVSGKSKDAVGEYQGRNIRYGYARKLETRAPDSAFSSSRQTCALCWSISFDVGAHSCTGIYVHTASAKAAKMNSTRS